MANIATQNVVITTDDAGHGNYLPALILLGVLYFMMGFITCLNDTLVPLFKAGFKLSYTESSLVQLYFFLTYGLMSVPAGKIVERIGYQRGIVIGFFISAFGALLFYPASVYHQYALFLAALFVLAIGIVMLQVAANPYITVLGPVKTASARLTLIQGVGSIGTTVAPLFGAAFILSGLEAAHSSSDAVRGPYLMISAFLFIVAIVVARFKLPAIHTAAKNEQESKSKSVFSFRNLNFGIIAIFMYVGAEVSIGTFLTNYIIDTIGVNTHTANSYVAFYWGGMLVGRLIGSVLLKYIHPPVVLAALALGAVALISLSLLTDGQLAIWAMIAVGICNAMMFAIIFSLSVSGLGTYTTRASGLLSTAIAGGAVLSFTEGVLRDRFSWDVAFMVPLICYGYLLFYGLNGYKRRFQLSYPDDKT